MRKRNGSQSPNEAKNVVNRRESEAFQWRRFFFAEHFRSANAKIRNRAMR